MYILLKSIRLKSLKKEGKNVIQVLESWFDRGRIGGITLIVGAQHASKGEKQRLSSKLAERGGSKSLEPT